ncbi:MAG: cysteine desulfurase family protein [Atopobiaceae bacterium]
MVEHYVYLDYAASAPMRREALEQERAYELAPYAGANPNSLHTLGRMSARALDGARADLARLLKGGIRPSDVIFTSSGTESNNLALAGIAEAVHAKQSVRRRIIISAIEHDSEEEIVPVLKARGFVVELIQPGRDGKISPQELRSLIGPDVALVSIMSANNETGVIQPIVELGRVAHAAGALFHTDASQAFCKVELDVSTADAITLSAHKLGGPVGIAALVVRSRCPLRPQIFGGGQEGGKRSGTQAVRDALAFAAAAKAAARELTQTRAIVAERAQALYNKLCSPNTGILPTTTAQVGPDRLPGMVSIMVPALDSETLVLQLDARGFEVSAASACASASLQPSHVLSAMGIPRDQALGSLRISFDERVEPDDLDRFADALLDIVKKLS